VKNLNFVGKSTIEFELFVYPIPIFIDQDDQKAAQRILAADWGGQEKALWIKASDASATLDYLGHPPNVIYVSDIPLPPKAPRAQRQYRSGATIEVLDLNGRRDH
jgi:hypothetical protein